MNKKPRLLHLSHTDIAYDSRILKEITAAKDSGYDVLGIGMSAREEELGQRKAADFDFILAPKIRSRYLLSLPRFLRLLVIYFEFFIKTARTSFSYKPRIVHCNDFVVLPIGLLVKFVVGSKLIYDAHELESNVNGQNRIVGNFVKILEKISWPFIDALVVVSPSIRKWYLQNFGRKPAVVVLNSPVVKGFDGLRRSTYLRDKFGIAKDEKIFLYIGMLESGRGIDLITNVFTNKNVNSHVVFLGFGSYKTRLIELTGRFSNIHVHDAVTHNKVVEITSSADVGLCLIENVSLSDYYCLPNKLFEYCFGGLPVLASGFPDISSLVQKYKLGLVTELKTDEVIEAVSRFESDNGVGSIPIKNLRVLKWETQAKKLMFLYKQVLNN